MPGGAREDVSRTGWLGKADLQVCKQLIRVGQSKASTHLHRASGELHSRTNIIAEQSKYTSVGKLSLLNQLLTSRTLFVNRKFDDISKQGRV